MRVQRHGRPLFTPRKDPVPIVHEAGWAPGPVWTGAENLVLTGIRSPDRPFRSRSLYRLRYPAHPNYLTYFNLVGPVFGVVRIVIVFLHKFDIGCILTQ
jgi:hypothetical protein